MPNENEQSNGFASRFYLTTPVEGGTSVVERYDIEALRLVDSESRNPANVGDSTHPVYFLNGEPKECAGGTGGGGGSDVKIFPKYKGGTLIANYTIDGANGRLYSPSVAEIYKKVTLWPPTNSSGSYMSEVGDNNEDNPFKTMISNYEFLLIHYAPTNSLSEERTMMLDAQSLKNSLPNNAVFSCHYLSDVFIKCKFTSQDKFEVVESEGIPLSDGQDPQLLKCAIKKIEGLQFGASGADLDQGLTIKEVLWSGVADEVDYTQKFKTDTIESFNYIYLHFYATNNKYEERILVIDQEAIIEGLTKDPSEAYFTCDISDDLYIKGKFIAIDEFTITEVQTKTIDGVVVKPVLNQIDGICMGSVGGSGSGDTSDCMKKGIDYITAGLSEEQQELFGDKTYNCTIEGGVHNILYYDESPHLNGGAHIEGVLHLINGAGSGAHIEGFETSALQANLGSHIEGIHGYIVQNAAHVEGNGCTAMGVRGSAITGYDFRGAHAEGYKTYTYLAGHAEGRGTSAIGSNYTDEGKEYSSYPHVEGINSRAAGEYAHAEGLITTAFHKDNNNNSPISNGVTKAFAFGTFDRPRNVSGHTEGCATYSVGHTEGLYTSALQPWSSAIGRWTVANNRSCFVIGQSNVIMEDENTSDLPFTKISGSAGQTIVSGDVCSNGPSTAVGKAFVIGNGTPAYTNVKYTYRTHKSIEDAECWSVEALIDEIRSNAFSVDFNGNVTAAGNISAANVADYAEYFEWVDANNLAEDRVGYFVAFDENETNKIRIANPNDDYILGIVSGAPFVLGNGDCDVWHNLYLKDNFGRIQYTENQKFKTIIEGEDEELECRIEPELDEKGNPIFIKAPVINPEYDSSQQYIPRKERAEWTPVGMLGVLAVRDDGTCIPGKYCKVAEGGIATYQATYNRNENCYRVTERVAENVVKIVFK